MSAWTQEEVDKAVSQVTKKAVTDRKFRQLVLKDPAKAVKEVSGKAIPPGYKIKVLEADPEFDVSFILPAPTSRELEESEVEAVAGGACVGNVCAQAECR